MSAVAQKSILIAGLGRNADPNKFPIHKVEEVLTIEMNRMREAGFDPVHIDLDPKDIAGSRRRLEETIASRDWDVFQVGFAVRGLVESTEVFEDAVNIWVKTMPGKKLIFPQGPHNISSAALRMLKKGF